MALSWMRRLRSRSLKGLDQAQTVTTVYARFRAKHLTAIGLRTTCGSETPPHRPHPPNNTVAAGSRLGFGNILFLSSEAGLHSQLSLTPQVSKTFLNYESKVLDSKEKRDLRKEREKIFIYVDVKNLVLPTKINHRCT